MMKVQKITLKDGETIISEAKPALLRNSKGSMFWALVHAQDAGRAGNLFLPIEGKAEPCLNNDVVVADTNKGKCHLCGMSLAKRRYAEPGGRLMHHPDHMYLPPKDNFRLRNTRNGGVHLIPTDEDDQASLVLLRPDGRWYEASKEVREVGRGQKGQEVMPALLAPMGSAIVFGKESVAESAVYLGRDGKWNVHHNPPQRKPSQAA